MKSYFNLTASAILYVEDKNDERNKHPKSDKHEMLIDGLLRSA